jgi:nuclear pore complex protein Nup160
MQSLYDKCNFAEDITSHQFEEIRSSLEDVGGFAGLRSHHFRAISENQSSSRKEPKLAFNQIGLGALVCGAQDMISLQLSNLQNLIYLLVFIFGEVDPAEELAETLELEETFLALVEHMKQAKLAYWLATKSRTSTVEMSGQPRNGTQPEMTVLRGLFAPDIKPHTEDVQDGRSGLTQAIQHLLSWVAGGNEISLDDAVVSIQCDLLRRRNLELATSFQSFLPATAWSTYVQGRLCILQEEFSEAAVFFKHAAFRLCTSNFLEPFATLS